MEYFFQTKQLSVGYDGNPLIKNIEVSLKKGEILTIIGPNGAGKSTILKSIARQLETICGTIFFGENELKQMTREELSKELAIVFTEKLRTECMTCEDVVATGRYPYTGRFGMLTEKDREMIKYAMQVVHVYAFRNQDFQKISDGQRQRVMLARAICQEPEIIILDEPTSFLDVKYKLEFLSILQKLQRQKQLTVIMSLHELELAQKISDQILCVKGEYISGYGSPDEIFKSGYIRELFEIETGSFDEKTGVMELEQVRGEASVFVIGGNGCGTFVYRRLQRAQIPFAAGILFENDLEYPVAKALASKVIGTPAFEPMSEESLKRAKEVLRTCKKVICCKKTFGQLEKKNEELLQYAKDLEVEIEME